MATSKVDISNLALSWLGNKTIMSLDEGTPESIVCSALIDHCIDVVTQAYNWNCALKEAELAPLSEPAAKDYAYSYQLPSDCLRPIRLYGHAPGKDYVLREDILCTAIEAPVYLTYIKRMSDDLSCMDPLLAAAVAARLASEMARKFSGSSSLVEQMTGLFATKVQEAKDWNAIADDQEYIEVETHSWITARD